MSNAGRVEIEVRRTPHGPEHVYACEYCEDGVAVYCQDHSRGACPCTGFVVDCLECNGTAELVEKDCGCSLCMQVVEDLEAMS